MKIMKITKKIISEKINLILSEEIKIIRGKIINLKKNN